MRVQIIDIGNSKGIRIPQAILKQAVFGDEIELEVSEGKIILKRTVDMNFVPAFSELPKLDDASIQQILRKISGVDLLTALIGASKAVKNSVYRNISPRVKQYLAPTVERLEKGDAKDLLIERSRNLICEALMDVVKG
jgi:antitoxin component of MazEF toxin-antitoxin module